MRGIPILKIQLFSRMFAKFGNLEIFFSDKKCDEHHHFYLFYEILKKIWERDRCCIFHVTQFYVHAELSTYKNEINTKGSLKLFVVLAQELGKLHSYQLENMHGFEEPFSFVVPALGSRILSSYQLENMHDF